MPFMPANAKHVLLASATLALATLPGASMAHESNQEATVASARAPTPYDPDPYSASPDLMRLENIGFELSTHNADACEKPDMLSGLVVHDVSDYAPKARAEVINKSHMTYGFGVLGLIAGSPAERAGLQIGDEIVRVNEKQLRDEIYDNLPDAATYTRIANFHSEMSSALAAGPAQIEVLRAGQPIKLWITGTPACGGRVSLQASKQLNAWSDGRYVAVTSRMMNFAKTDDELAFVIAHEMAHNIKKHADQLKARSSLLASFGLGSGKFYKTEAEADEVAISLIATTKYNPAGSQGLLRKFTGSSILYMSPTHPSFGSRLAIVQEAISKIPAPKLELANLDIELKNFCFSRCVLASSNAVPQFNLGSFLQGRNSKLLALNFSPDWNKASAAMENFDEAKEKINRIDMTAITKGLTPHSKVNPFIIGNAA